MKQISKQLQGPVIDVEATGPSPLGYSMIEIGLVDLHGNEFTCRMRPREGTSYVAEAMASIGLTWEEVQDWPDPAIQMREFHTFLQDTYGGKRISSWSDNPGFDWAFINAYLHHYCDNNPLGWSMRRIGDLYAGHVGDSLQTSKWKSLRDTKHTHEALDDARGNAEALGKILNMMARK